MVDGERIAADDTAEKLGLEVPFRVPGKMLGFVSMGDLQ